LPARPGLLWILWNMNKIEIEIETIVHTVKQILKYMNLMQMWM
jgi:hypothetical protein